MPSESEGEQSRLPDNQTSSTPNWGKPVKPVKKPNPAHWKPGQTGNPKGRPPGIYARDLARNYTDLAIDTLVKALGYQRTMVPAAVALLDRGWGKPKETVEGAFAHLMVGGIDSPPIPETLDAWLQRRRAQLESQLDATKVIEHDATKTSDDR